MATADPLPPAILSYITQNTYPSSETLASTPLDPPTLTPLLTTLRTAQNAIKTDIRSLSKSTAPDIDTWISRASALQSDIVRSRNTAREIVAEHEVTQRLRAQAEEARRKVGLLEKEVGFQETLGGVLDHVGFANGGLERVQDAVVQGDMEGALREFERAESSIGGLEGFGKTRAVGLLKGRAGQLKESLRELATDAWHRLVQVDYEGKSITIRKSASPDESKGVVKVDVVVKALQSLDLFGPMLQKLGKDLEKILIRPRLAIDDHGQVTKIAVSGDTLSCAGRVEDQGTSHLISDLRQTIDFLAESLPPSVGTTLSETLIPALTAKLEEQWLEPSIPLDLKDMPAFQQTLDAVQDFVDHIDTVGWHGSKKLKEWVSSAPRTWLTKRREAVLGDVRNLVFSGLKETKVVERVETQMVSRNDYALQSGGDRGEDAADDEWDAWDEPQEDDAPAAQSRPSAEAEDEDASAWDIEDGAGDDKPVAAAGGDDEGDAWGWGDEEAASQGPPSPVTPKKPAPARKVNGDSPSIAKPQEREMTLRETFTVTAIPDGILNIIQTIITDAQTLAGPDHSTSTIAPAAPALYTLPTLALAIYRATAPTAYTKIPAAGNMLIYNDSLRLADQLRSWQASQPPNSRLRLDNDVASLESFAKRAYGAEMESQRTILRDLLDGAQGFAHVTRHPFRQAADGAVSDVVARLREVRRQWQEVLSTGVLRQALGSLVAGVMAQMIREIEEVGDIGEEDSHELRRLMDVVMATVKEFFVVPQAEATSPGAGGAEAADMTFIYCPNWFKFQYLAEILESSLADIKYMWTQSELSLEFEGEEVIELIEGLFADSEVRRRTIAEIRRGGRR